MGRSTWAAQTKQASFPGLRSSLCKLYCYRQRLSNDSFSLFLQAIKELNSGKKTREDTLHTANDIFGAANGDLYGELPKSAAHGVLCHALFFLLILHAA